MQRENNLSLSLEIQPSLRLRRMLMGLYFLGLLALFISVLSIFIKIVVSVFVLGVAWVTIKRLNSSYYSIRYSDNLGWEFSAGGNYISIDILQSTVITPYLLFLHFKESSKRDYGLFSTKRACLIFNDAITDVDYRNLVVKLKITVIK